MKFKNNKGYVGVDVTIALMVVIILIPTITAITFNINKSSNSIQRKTQAISIATNAMESAKIVFSEEEAIEDTESDVILGKIIEKLKENYVDNSDIEGGFLITINDTLYKVEIKLQDKHKIDDSVEEGKISVVTAKTTYKVGNNEENISLSTNFAINN